MGSPHSRIAVNVALDYLRKTRRRRNEIELSELGEDALEWLRTGDEARELESRHAAELLALALHQ